MMEKFLIKLSIKAVLILLPFILIIFVCLVPFTIFAGKDLFEDNQNPAYINAEYGSGNVKVTGGRFTWPVPASFKISSGFGNRVHPIKKEKLFHSGIDIAVATGNKVLAADKGTVSFAGSMSGYGLTVIINHIDGIQTLYGHNSKILVRTGESVDKGKEIALSGNTGNSTGPHLHFEVRNGSEYVDPAEFIQIEPDIQNTLPDDLLFKEIDHEKMIQWLSSYNSYLADEYHVNAIITAGRKYNLNAFLLFAITGQEQSFVSKSSSSAAKIARNPFNVYHSWYEYSPGIETSAEVAAGTVGKLSKGRPENVDPIKWLNSPGLNPNGSYAEDRNWWIGVSKFFNQLKDQVGYKE